MKDGCNGKVDVFGKANGGKCCQQSFEDVVECLLIVPETREDSGIVCCGYLLDYHRKSVEKGGLVQGMGIMEIFVEIRFHEKNIFRLDGTVGDDRIVVVSGFPVFTLPVDPCLLQYLIILEDSLPPPLSLGGLIL